MLNSLKRVVWAKLQNRLSISKNEMDLLATKQGIVLPVVTADSVVNLIEQFRPRGCPEDQLVRLGPKGDGGYLIPDDLDGIEACFSPGVGDLVGFELDCLSRGMNVFLADASIEKLPVDDKRLNFTRRFLGATTCNGTISLADWIEEAGVSDASDLLLQMDIEGAEFETLLAVPDSLLRRFRIITLELHRLEEMWTPLGNKLIEMLLKKLLAFHEIVHIHPNNYSQPYLRNGIDVPPLLEVTLWRRDRIRSANCCSPVPHPLDENCTSKAAVSLSQLWK